ncbi:MAG: hypothetical protein DCC67_00570 [Planctomycetota bacterium]|nr:MAG: hypothetical protein DCC67_00570 [Planctomycetota bacterium]
MQTAGNFGQTLTPETGGLTGGWTSEFQPHRSAESQISGQQIVDALRQYARERPETVALWAFGLGFVLGWRLKPW